MKRIVVTLYTSATGYSPDEVVAAAQKIVYRAADFGGTHRSGLVRWALTVIARARRWRRAA